MNPKNPSSLISLKKSKTQSPDIKANKLAEVDLISRKCSNLENKKFPARIKAMVNPTRWTNNLAVFLRDYFVTKKNTLIYFMAKHNGPNKRIVNTKLKLFK